MPLRLYSNFGFFDFQRTHFRETYSEMHHLLALLSSMFVIDRSGTLKTGFNGVSYPIPKPGKVGTFADICDVRATELMNEAEERNKIIDIHWSGGIDSTVALVAFLRNALDEDFPRLRVVMTQASINEYPLFYEEHIKGKLNVFRMEEEPDYKGRKYFIDESHISVTGDHGDQLFGSDRYLTYTTSAFFHRAVPPGLIKTFRELCVESLHGLEMPFEEFLPVVISHQANVTDAATCRLYADRLVKFLRPLLDSCTFKIVTTRDFLWWINFTQKWHSVMFRTTHTQWCPTAVDISDYRTFFSSDDFQRWAIDPENHKSKVVGFELEGYKMPAKEYIYGYTKDAKYRDTKLKYGSLRTAVPDQNINPMTVNYFFLDDGKIRYFNTYTPSLDADYREAFGCL